MSNILEITFKDEEEIGNEPVGPVTVTMSDSTKKELGWRRLCEARALASEHGLPLERF